MKQNNIIEIKGKKYAFIHDAINDENECERCALRELCDNDDGCICHNNFGVGESEGMLFVEVEDSDVTEQNTFDYYQEKSYTAGSRCDQLAWMFVVMLTGAFISGHTYQLPYNCVAFAIIYVLMSIFQSVWQTFTFWLFYKQIKGKEVMPKDYPSWIGCGAWFFFWLKIIAISAAALYFIHGVLSSI